MNKHMRKMTIVILIVTLTLSAACTNTNNNNKGIEESNNNRNQENNFRPLGMVEDDAHIPLLNQNGMAYVPIQELIDVLGYQSEMNSDTQTLSIGDIDVFYKITADSNRAEKEEEPLELSGAPMMMDGKVYVPVSVIADLFQEDMHYDVVRNELLVHPTQELEPGIEDLDSLEEAEAAIGELFFQDDPNDPFKGEEPNGEVNDDVETSTNDLNVWTPTASDDVAPVSYKLKNINMNAMIRTAKRYMGVPYKFGAGPYRKTRKFDCSSYTQYIFDKYGVNLRRVSRNQAKQGHSVSRKNLRKGDLLFFYVPGRFKSNKKVGHVGIYIGNGKMINTFSNKKGVHITNVNKGYWSKKYLGAKRVAY